MGKLQINDDGTVTIPVRGSDAIVLQEPTVYELAEIHRIVDEADAALGVIPPLEQDATREQMSARRGQMEERTRTAFGHESPHAKAMVEIVAMLDESDRVYTEKDLPGWCCHPSTAGTILIHFRSPLPGPESSDEETSETQ